MCWETCLKYAARLGRMVQSGKGHLEVSEVCRGVAGPAVGRQVRRFYFKRRVTTLRGDKCTTHTLHTLRALRIKRLGTQNSNNSYRRRHT